MNRTRIEWTDYSWNPITGCKHGCWYCYARKLAQRFKKIFPNGFEPTYHPLRLKEPWELKKPSKIFVCSIADLFASWTPSEWRDAVVWSIQHCPIKHTFQLLTKNPERIPDMFWPENVWLGTTVTCDWKANDYKNIPAIVHARAKVRFVSFEPLLGPLPHAMTLRGIDWVIIGKLTGSRKVELNPAWVEDIIHEATDYDIPVFMKNNLSPPWPKEDLIQEFPSESVLTQESKEVLC
jgi:protein gp37